MQLSEGIELARYRFSFRITEAMQLPEYAGSALRGVFGRALMQLSGLQLRDIKEKTPLFLHSPYAEIFEPQANPQALGILAKLQGTPPLYVVEAPTEGVRFLDKGENLAFSAVLAGQALTHLPLVILAWRRALLMGLGRGHAGRAELIRVEHEQPDGTVACIYSEDKPLVQEHVTLLLPPVVEAAADVHLHFLTPLRLQHNGKVLGTSELTPSLLQRQLVRRMSIYWQMQQTEAVDVAVIARLNALADSVTKDEKRLSFKRWARYSSRQQQLMQMDGVQGHWLLCNVPVQMQQLLWYGQYLHVGKGTAFGLGGYVISQQMWQPLIRRNLADAV